VTPDQIPASWWLLTTAVLLVFGTMLFEARVSWRNERALRARGAVEPSGDVWRVMSIAYPSAFAAMAIESALRGGPSAPRFYEGLLIWGAAKLLKVWAVTTLGDRWSFRVLVLPGASLIARGPYRLMRHPNYLAVIGEFAGAATMMAAPTAFLVSTAIFVGILRRRIRVEERALGIFHARPDAG
jgi:methyltransferase